MTSEPCLHIVLYQPEIPQNTGNIGRTCVALRAKLWLVRPLGFRLDESHLRRAGLDYWQHLNWEAVDNWAALESRLSGRRLWFYSKAATQAYTHVSYREGDVLVFGAETAGLPESFRAKYPAAFCSIPMPGPVRSLNLSNAVAVVAYEAFRQLDLP